VIEIEKADESRPQISDVGKSGAIRLLILYRLLRQ
jgi:hypothetical protein